MEARFPLRRKLLVSTVGSLGLGVVFTVVLLVVLLVTGFPTWIETAEDAMIRAESDNLQRLSVEKAEWVDAFFADAKGNLEHACTYMEDLLRGAAPIERHLEKFSTLTDDHPDDFDKNLLESGASLGHTGWYLCNTGPLESGEGCEGIEDVSALDANAQSQLNVSDGMTLFYKGLYQSGFPIVPGGFFAVNFEDDGLVRLFPYQPLDSFIDEFELTCNGEERVGYDPRCRPWWDGAKDEPQPNVFFTAPFSWTVQGLEEPVLGISAGRKFYNYTNTVKENDPPGVHLDPTGTSLDDITGVCAFEPPMSGVVSRVTEPLSDRGYGYMIAQETKDQVAHPAVSHPDLLIQGTDAERTSIFDLESFKSSEKADFENSVLQNMKDGERGTANYRKGGENWYIAYHNVSSADYSLATTMPEEDIREPFREARNRINATIGVQIAIIVAVLVVLLIVIFLYARRISSSIEKPINLLLALVTRINSRNFSGEELQAIDQVADTDYLSRELAALDKVFRQMYLAVQVGQASFLSGNMEQAEKTFNDAMALFARLGHEKGLGVCHTNLGAVYVYRRAYTQAISSYEDAIRNAEDLVERSQSEGEEQKAEVPQSVNSYTPQGVTGGSERKFDKNSLVSTLATRQLNLAKAFASRARYALQTHWPQRFIPADDVGSFPDADPPVSISQSLDDLSEAVKLSHECLQTMKSCESSLVEMMEVRCDAVKVLALYAEVVRICEETGAAKPKVGSNQAISDAESEMAALMQEYQQCEAADEETEEFYAQQCRALASQGDLLMAKGQVRDAILVYSHALTSFPTVDALTLTDISADLNVALRCLGYHNQAKLVMDALPGGERKARDFIFLLDRSGSMAGSLIQRAVNNMVQLYDDHVKPSDRLSVYTFSTTVTQAIRMSEKGSGSTAEATRKQMSSLTRAGGLTACYDAIWRAMDTFQSVRDSQNRSKVIVCLTDGDDNMSSHKVRELVERFGNDTAAQNVMLVIVAVGRLNTAEQLRSIAESSKGGTLVEAKKGLDDLDKAFEEVSNLISGGEFRLETL
eukprot:gb/GECG01010321.1/.p1 GENE.gb/GECG01010321.1/~~gb/GECG01010321.1/.p1  ORF type:complete len:1043 (+),score=133.72 gb/GECG01010321.1/:1-3129(+)